MANVGNVFIKRLQTLFFILFSTFHIFNFFVNFYLNVYYIYRQEQENQVSVAN